MAAANAPNIIDASTDSTPPGSQVWSKTFGGTGDEWAFSVIQTFDGGYATAGYTTSSGAGKADVWLVKTDSLGNQQWNKTYGGKEFDWASCVIQTKDGGYALAGSTYTSVIGVMMSGWLKLTLQVTNSGTKLMEEPTKIMLLRWFKPLTTDTQ